MNSQLTNIIFIAAMVGIFYFLLIRPQQKRAQQQREMIARLAPGARIVTIGGIFATVVEVGDRLKVRVLDGSEFELSKQAVGQVLPSEDEEIGFDVEAADPVVGEDPPSSTPGHEPAGDDRSDA